MKKIMLQLLLLLPAMAMAQVVEVNVTALAEEGSNERVGVVLKKDAETETFYNLVVELKNHSDKVNATHVVESRKNSKSEAEIMAESIAKMDDLRKRGILDDAEYERMKSALSAQLSKNAEYAKMLEEQAAGAGSSNPSVLKERIRSYCIGKRFFYSASNEVNGMVRVEARTADGKRRQGFIDVAKGEVVIEPDRYGGFNVGNADKQFHFTKDGYIIGWMGNAAELLDRSGRVVLTGYERMHFYDDCRILRARNAEQKWGIIDYEGNVLEPFVHDSHKSASLAKAANRIFNEKGGKKVEIW